MGCSKAPRSSSARVDLQSAPSPLSVQLQREATSLSIRKDEMGLATSSESPAATHPSPQAQAARPAQSMTRRLSLARTLLATDAQYAAALASDSSGGPADATTLELRTQLLETMELFLAEVGEQAGTPQEPRTGTQVEARALTLARQLLTTMQVVPDAHVDAAHVDAASSGGGRVPPPLEMDRLEVTRSPNPVRLSLRRAGLLNSAVNQFLDTLRPEPKKILPTVSVVPHKFDASGLTVSQECSGREGSGRRASALDAVTSPLHVQRSHRHSLEPEHLTQLGADEIDRFLGPSGFQRLQSRSKVSSCSKLAQSAGYPRPSAAQGQADDDVSSSNDSN